MLCIRISEQEYEGLKSVCEARGARSISDLAREAVSRLVELPAERTMPEWVQRVEEIDFKVERLKDELNRIQGLLAPSGDSLDDLRALEAVNGT